MKGRYQVNLISQNTLDESKSLYYSFRCHSVSLLAKHKRYNQTLHLLVLRKNAAISLGLTCKLGPDMMVRSECRRSQSLRKFYRDFKASFDGLLCRLLIKTLQVSLFRAASIKNWLLVPRCSRDSHLCQPQVNGVEPWRLPGEGFRPVHYKTTRRVSCRFINKINIFST